MATQTRTASSASYPEILVANDGQTKTFSIGSPPQLSWSDFGFSIPSVAEILAISFSVRMRAVEYHDPTGDGHDAWVGRFSGASPDYVQFGIGGFPGAFFDCLFEHDDPLWDGTGWTPAMFNSSLFSCELDFAPTISGTAVWEIDGLVGCTVTYNSPATGGRGRRAWIGA